ncbi:hypothetical protein Tco_0958641, partial [Tanacetum coccineum]
MPSACFVTRAATSANQILHRSLNGYIVDLSYKPKKHKVSSSGTERFPLTRGIISMVFFSQDRLFKGGHYYGPSAEAWGSLNILNGLTLRPKAGQ